MRHTGCLKKRRYPADCRRGQIRSPPSARRTGPSNGRWSSCQGAFANGRAIVLYRSSAFPAGSGPDFVNAGSSRGVMRGPKPILERAARRIGAEGGAAAAVANPRSLLFPPGGGWGPRSLDLDLIALWRTRGATGSPRDSRPGERLPPGRQARRTPGPRADPAPSAAAGPVLCPGPAWPNWPGLGASAFGRPRRPGGAAGRAGPPRTARRGHVVTARTK